MLDISGWCYGVRWLHFCSQCTSTPCIFVLSVCQCEHLYTRTLSWIKGSPQTAAWASQMNLASISRVNTSAELFQNRSGAGGKLLEARGSWKTECLEVAKHRQHCCLSSCLQPLAVHRHTEGSRAAQPCSHQQCPSSEPPQHLWGTSEGTRTSRMVGQQLPDLRGFASFVPLKQDYTTQLQHNTESRAGPEGWSSSPMKAGWDTWGCSAWKRESLGTALEQPSNT